MGVYFYSQAVSYEEGVEEAQFVLQQVKAYNINLPIVLDTEDTMDESARTGSLTGAAFRSLSWVPGDDSCSRI